jgi:hypothetical protein
VLTIGLLLSLVLPPVPGGAGVQWYTGSAATRPRMLTESVVGGVGISGAGIDEVVATAPGGTRADYCSYAQLGSDHPTPCRTDGERWSWTLRGSPSTNYCSGVDANGAPNAPCNIHHFASNAGSGLGDRPWDTERFGPFPSFVVETDVTAGSQRVLQGAWGFVCPLFADTTAAPPRTEVVEFCVEEWRFGTLFPSLPGGPTGFDVAPMAPVTAWRRGRSYDLDQVVTAVEPGRAFATMRPGSATTWEGPGSHHLAFAISRANMSAALRSLRTTWARDISEVPGDYAYVGIEEGI